MNRITITARALAFATTAAALTLGASACSELDGAIDEVSAAPAAASDPQSLCEIGSCEDFTVDRVIDGDTVDVATDGGTVKRVRVLGIDTPESVHPDQPIECMGPEASETATSLAPVGAKATVVTDAAADSEDAYGRTLGHVLIKDEVNWGEAMLSSGLARTTDFPHSLQESYAGTEQTAQHEDAGIWGTC